MTRTSGWTLIMVLAIFGTSSAGLAEPKAPPTGDWVGWAYLDEGSDLPLRMRVEPGPDGLVARFDELVGRRYDLPVETLEWTPARFFLRRVRPDGKVITLEGTIDGERASGSIDWVGHHGDFELDHSPRRISRTPPEQFKDLEGIYRLDPGGDLVISSRFWGELLFTRIATGRFGTLFPVDTDRFFAGSAMYVPWPVHAEASFVRDDQGRVTGIEWKEAGRPAIHGDRTELVEQQVAFESDGATLAGTILRPAGAQPLPGAVVLGGSNWADREVNRRDASIFASFGMVTLIYDKRGFGESGGEETVPFSQTARDAAAAVRFLRSRPGVIADQVGLTGRSRSGWIAPLAASIDPSIDFLVLFVPPAVSPASQETTRRLHELEDDGVGPQKRELVRRMLDAAWAYAATGKGWETYAKLRREAVEAGVPDDVVEPAKSDDPDWEWTRMNMAYDPLPTLETVKTPLIALFGAKDRNVVPEINRPRMDAALKRAGNPDYRLVVVPKADHGLRIVTEGKDVPLHRRVGFGPSGWPDVEAWLRDRVALWGRPANAAGGS